jgi:hypothetical protein
MPGVAQVTKTGPRTYTPADNEIVTGGHLVEGRAGGRIGLAAAGSLKVLGVAIADATAPEDAVYTPVVVNGRNVLNAAPGATEVGVAYGGVETKVEYAAAAAFGDPLVAASLGRVTPAGATPDARTIVARCTDPAGVSGAGVYGLTRIF